MVLQEQTYDIVVIGSGPSGREFSLHSTKNGFSVALIESELVGGDCAYWSCVPSKALLRPPEALAEARQVEGAKQAAVGNLGVESVLKRRDFYVDNWDDHNLTKVMEEDGVHIMRGHGRLDGHKRVVVNSNGGSSTTQLLARYAVVLSTGSSSTIPNVPGLVQARPWSSRNATSAKKVPHRLAIMGDGAVACEMADIWSSLGAKVTILSRHKKILERFEPFAGDQLAAGFTKRGITIHTKVNVVQVERSNPNEPVQIELDNGSMIEADEILVAVGRTPKTGDIGLETVGLKSQQWLNVDDTCLVQGLDESENNWLYAIGDINRRALLTHIGKYQGRACAKAILARAKGTVINNHSKWNRSNATADLDMIPQVIFTDPQVASVGLTEKDVKRLGLNARSVDAEMSTVVGAQLHTDGYVGHARLVIDEDKHIIVGATFIGPQVSELLHSATVAIVGQIPIDRLWHAVPSFPTMSEVWVQLLDN